MGDVSKEEALRNYLSLDILFVGARELLADDPYNKRLKLEVAALRDRRKEMMTLLRERYAYDVKQKRSPRAA